MPCVLQRSGVLRALIRRQLDDMIQLASAADTTKLAVAIEQFIDEVVNVVKERNDWEKK